MRKTLIGASIVVTFTLAISGIVFAGNQEDCQAWCDKQADCVKCERGNHCSGASYNCMKLFNERRGRNYCACRRTDYGRASDTNEKACNDFCGSNELCERCSSKQGCGSGYTSIKDFRGRGENWHACANRDKLSEAHKKLCDDWCDKDPFCEKCSSKSGCGVGYYPIAKFRGPGENWYACGEKRIKEMCEEYCQSHKPPCELCSANPGCGQGYSSMKAFKSTPYSSPSFGLGIMETVFSYLQKNWYACRKRGDGGEKTNKESCEEFCKDHDSVCAKCSKKSGCGVGYRQIAKFRGPGTNWYACELEYSTNKTECEEWCEANKPACVGCDTRRYCGPGREAMKHFTDGVGTNWHACKNR